MDRCQIKLESAAPGYSFRYSAAVFSISILARASVSLGALACAACAGLATKAVDAPPSSTFYTVTAEIALARHEPRLAALQYASAAARTADAALLRRATEVASAGLQPSLVGRDAARWIAVDPGSLDAHRAAARAALELHQISEAAAQYRTIVLASPAGEDAEFDQLESELTSNENSFGARQVADCLAALFPKSQRARRLQGLTALRAEDPAAAVESLSAALRLEGSETPADRHELMQALARAKILSGDVEAPLAAARESAERDSTPDNRLDYVLLLITARHDAAAIMELESLTQNADDAPLALRLLGLLEFQRGRLEAASARFAELLRRQKFTDDAFYYLALIADGHGDTETALRLYAQVQSGGQAVAALLRASSLLNTHGARAAAEELLDGLTGDQPQRAPEILAARARMYAGAGDAARAFEVLQRGIEVYPDSVALRYALASADEESGRVPAAVKELRRLVKSRPADPAALNALGYTLADHRLHLAQARRLIERAKAAAPGNAAILDSWGWVLFRQDHAAEAEIPLRLAYARERSGDIAAHLGEVLWRLGRAADAEHLWYEAAAVDPDNRLLKQTRQRFNGLAPSPTRHLD